MLEAKQLESWLPCPGQSAVCAVSGGLDSMCLLHLMSEWCRTREIPLTAAHFNHQLRPTADRDELFVRNWCAAQNIPFVSGRADVRSYALEKHLSPEEAARILRYRFLRHTLLTQNPPAVIYTAHHLNDNAETVLLNLIRGTGIRGLCGMEHRRDDICRPFLDIPRSELEAYAAYHNIPHVEDETNADADAAARNFLRLEVMPLLKQLNPKAETHIHAAAVQLSVIDHSLDADARERTKNMEVQNGRVILPVRELLDASEALRPRMILCALDRLGIGRKDIGSAHLLALQGLFAGPERIDRGRERRVNLPHGVTAHCLRGQLILEICPQTLEETELLPEKPLRWGEYILTLKDFMEMPPQNWEQHTPPRNPEGHGFQPPQGMQTHGVFLRAPRRNAQGELLERNRITVAPCPPGGRLTLSGSNGSRSIKRLCLDHHISLPERDTLPAFYCDGVLAAVWRIGTDAAFVPDTYPCRLIEILKTDTD